MVSKVTADTKAVIIVHIGGHIAFEIEKIAKYCEKHNIALVEDCAHAHGAKWNGKAAGSYGLAGSYSFYATKTMPLGEGGMIVSKKTELIEWMERLPVILEWKRSLAQKFDRIFDNRVTLPDGMKSGYYKYIVFDQDLKEETGKVFNHTDFGNEIEGTELELPNSYWVAKHHKCVPIYYGWDKAGLSVEEIKKYLTA